MKALVVDDSRTMRRFLSAALGSVGFSVAEACDGKAALDQIRDLHGGYGLLLIDWNMPVMDGLALVKAIRADKSLDRPYIIMITSEVHPESMARALLAGVDEYLMKPITEESLKDKLQLLGLPQ